MWDFLGFGKSDAVTHDQAIEDSSYDGSDVPVFVDHHGYRDRRTNVEFDRQSQHTLVPPETAKIAWATDESQCPLVVAGGFEPFPGPWTIPATNATKSFSLLFCRNRPLPHREG